MNAFESKQQSRIQSRERTREWVGGRVGGWAAEWFVGWLTKNSLGRLGLSTVDAQKNYYKRDTLKKIKRVIMIMNTLFDSFYNVMLI